MKLPKNAKREVTLTTLEGDVYLIVLVNDTRHLYKDNGNNDYTFLGTSNNPTKLEEKVFGGKIQ